MSGEKKIRLESGWYINDFCEYEYLHVSDDGTCTFYDFETGAEGKPCEEVSSVKWKKVLAPLIHKGIVIWSRIHKYHPPPFFSAVDDAPFSEVTLIALEKHAVVIADDNIYVDNRWLEYTVLRQYFELDELDESWLPFRSLPTSCLGSLKQVHSIKDDTVLVRAPEDREFMLVYTKDRQFVFGSNDSNFITYVLGTIQTAP